MPAIDSAILLEEAKCYLCLGVTLADALRLALLSRISQGVAGPLIIDNINLAPNQPYNAAHGLGGVPSDVRAVFKFTNPVGGYAVGDEIEFSYIFGGGNEPPITVGSNATNVWLTSNSEFSGGTAQVENKGGGGGGAITTLDSSDGVGKIYLWR